jgi:hypothetical protein
MVLIVISLITLAVTFADKYHDILKLIGKGW